MSWKKKFLVLGILAGLGHGLALAQNPGPGNLGPRQLMPIPKVRRVGDKSFEKFRKVLHLAVADGRVKDILALSVESVGLPDGKVGPPQFGILLREGLALRKAQKPNILEEIQKALEAGCGFSRTAVMVACPGFSLDYPPEPYRGAAALVWGRLSSVFRQPFEKSRLLEEVNGVQIPLCNPPHQARGFYCVQIPGQPMGYIRSSEAWLSHGIRLGFVKEMGEWRLAAVRGTWPLLPSYEVKQWVEGP